MNKFKNIIKAFKDKAISIWEARNDFKQEMLLLPFLLVFMTIYQFWMSSVYPEDHQMSIPSTINYIVMATVKLSVLCLVGWIFIRATFPNLFKFMREEFYEFGDRIEYKDKIKYSILTFFGFLYALILLS